MIPTETWRNIGAALLFMAAVFLFVFLIVGSLAFLAYMDVEWAQRVLERK